MDPIEDVPLELEEALVVDVLELRPGAVVVDDWLPVVEPRLLEGEDELLALEDPLVVDVLELRPAAALVLDRELVVEDRLPEDDVVLARVVVDCD